MSDFRISIAAVLTGKARLSQDGSFKSGIAKQRCSEAQRVGVTGFHGDEQGDLKRHGGLEKAVHHYPFEHYSYWTGEIGAREVLEQPGAFGENLSTLGITEHNCCIGDVFQAGTAVLQVSQARQPCWKLNLRFDHMEMSRLVQSSRRTGWYYRVLEPGVIKAGDALTLLARPCPVWPLARLLSVLYDRSSLLDHQALEAMSNLAPLAQSWRRLAAQRLETGKVESWATRLHRA